MHKLHFKAPWYRVNRNGYLHVVRPLSHGHLYLYTPPHPVNRIEGAAAAAREIRRPEKPPQVLKGRSSNVHILKRKSSVSIDDGANQRNLRSSDAGRGCNPCIREPTYSRENWINRYNGASSPCQSEGPSDCVPLSVDIKGRRVGGTSNEEVLSSGTWDNKRK